ncbi:glycine cleavage system aminomethyltransferase GcvT [Agaribacterium haliotis]|uniref:glycine cleavage system aminomethyltransferase GcvT n=1 Tax=Agaribacterium haliotis TaxID=2013869 RepID=UPI000BB573B0|nr:glycine cleavage system aminomethyltransferase GcvT [Agaribacterium haliotis]
MLKETALVDLHRELGAKLVDFGGWLMPLHYGSQMEEHHRVRQGAGWFDVSHMTVLDVHGADAKRYLQFLLANDVAKLTQPGKALYSGMLNERAGVIDDLIVYLCDFGYRVVVNCATREKDLAWMQKQAANFEVSLIERDELAMLAVQGPKARALVGQLLPVPDLGVFVGADVKYKTSNVFVARTGYTGEDGYEVILPASEAVAFVQQLGEVGVAPCGLGARDTLRLEAGMNLYGHEMDEAISPLEANMSWTLDWSDSGRDFIGKKALLQQKADGVKNKLVGLLIKGKGVLRAGQEVRMSGSEASGLITSGSFSPTLSTSIALARVPVEFNGECQVIIRNKEVAVDIVKPCFVRNGANIVKAI